MKRRRADGDDVHTRRGEAIRHLIVRLDRTGSLRFLRAADDPAAPDHLTKLVKEQGFQGVRLSPAGDGSGDWIRGPLMPPLGERCRQLRVPMTILAPITRMPDVGRLIEKFPDLTVVIDHMADCPVDQPQELEKLVALERYEGVYVKVPGRDTWPRM